MVSVICPVFNEEKYIVKCIDSIVDQDYPKDDLEVLFVDGMSIDKTREIILRFGEKYSWIKLLDNPDKIVPYAMNIGIEAAKGDIIVRIDAHSYYASNYISALVMGLSVYNADNIGTVCRTDILNKTAKTLAIKEVLSNRFGVGNSLFRTGITTVREVDTVPFGCWRREVFDKCGLYDTRLVRNQDIELNKRIIRGGGKIVIIPDSYCTYLARETFRGIAGNNYQNGRWNILTVYYTKQFGSLSLRHFIPMCFILSLIIPFLFSFIWYPFLYLSALSLLLYSILIITISVGLSVKKRLNLFYLLSSFFIIHLSYGWGSVSGIIRIILEKFKLHKSK